MGHRDYKAAVSLGRASIDSFAVGEIIDLSDAAMEKRLVRKIDMNILPWVCMAYLINYLDRTNLGNAKTLNIDTPEYNLLTQLDLTGIRYNIVVAIFFVPYVLMEFPSNIFLKYFSPKVWIGRIMITWGLVTVGTAAVSSYRGLLIARFLLGTAEAGFYPAVIYLFCYWYKPSERATRMAIFAGSVAVAGAFGGLLATAISFLNAKAGLSGWQWLFILEGVPAVILGIAMCIWMPNYPNDAKFLTPEERTFAVARLGVYAPSKDDKHFDREIAKQTLKEPIFWLYAVQYFLMTNSLNAYGYFAPTIITTLGWSGYKAQLMTVPPNVFAFFVIVGNCWHSDREKERIRHTLAGLAFVGTGYLLLAVVHQNAIRYMAVFLIACTNAAVLPFLAHRTATVSGSTATALATGGMIALSNCGGITAPFLFPSSASPNYEMGNYTVFAFLFVCLGTTYYLGMRLGTGSDYTDVEVMAGEAVESDGLHRREDMQDDELRRLISKD